MLEKFPTSAGYRAGILFIYVCFVAIYWVTPLYGDDLCFIKDYAAHTGSNELTIRGICDFSSTTGIPKTDVFPTCCLSLHS